MSDSFPSNSNNTNIKCNVTIINSEFNTEIVNQLISTTENRLKEISNVNISKIENTENATNVNIKSQNGHLAILAILHVDILAF